MVEMSEMIVSTVALDLEWAWGVWGLDFVSSRFDYVSSLFFETQNCVGIPL